MLSVRNNCGHGGMAEEERERARETPPIPTTHNDHIQFNVIHMIRCSHGLNYNKNHITKQKAAFNNDSPFHLLMDTVCSRVLLLYWPFFLSCSCIWQTVFSYMCVCVSFNSGSRGPAARHSEWMQQPYMHISN